MFIRLGDVGISIESTDPLLKLDVLADGAAPGSVHLRLQAHRGRLTTPFGREIFRAGKVWRLFDTGEGYLFRFFTCGSVPYQEVETDYAFERGRVGLSADCLPGLRPAHPLRYPVDQVLLVHHLAGKCGVLVHGTGVVDSNGDSYLFTGHSGDGKTTMARLWQAAGAREILSDERVIVRLDSEKVNAHGTPWPSDGGYVSSSSATLRRIFILGKGEVNTIEPLSLGQATAMLAARSILPFREPQFVGSALQTIAEIVSRVECFALNFLPSPDIVRAIRELPDRRPYASGVLFQDE